MALSYYRTGSLLRAKHRLVRFDSGRRFETWALGLVPALGIVPVGRSRAILDAGCGWGRFTWSMVEDFGIPAEQITCADLSHGMLCTLRDEARGRVGSATSRAAPNSPAHRNLPNLCQASIEALPFKARSFDFAVAGHVLYHLRDLARGARELARVLQPDGTLLVTTNSDSARVLVLDLHYQALRDLGIPVTAEEDPAQPSPFSMETGKPYLGAAFARVQPVYFRDTTTFPDVETFMAGYRTMGRYRAVVENASIPSDRRQRLATKVEELARREAERTGALRSEVVIGAFICREPLPPASCADPREM
jgi:ubiquinone/menaquinone biosynthesis C-methylase UbiE